MDEEAGAATAASQRDRAAGFDALIERWWEEHFPGSAVARYTEAWNVAHSAKEALKALFRKDDGQCS
jgi:hypothetical protein